MHKCRYVQQEGRSSIIHLIRAWLVLNHQNLRWVFPVRQRQVLPSLAWTDGQLTSTDCSPHLLIDASWPYLCPERVVSTVSTIAAVCLLFQFRCLHLDRPRRMVHQLLALVGLWTQWYKDVPISQQEFPHYIENCPVFKLSEKQNWPFPHPFYTLEHQGYDFINLLIFPFYNVPVCMQFFFAKYNSKPININKRVI